MRYNGGVNKMKKFTYVDYLKYQQYVENIIYFKSVLKEDSATYQYEKQKVECRKIY